jgi:hypothetical protein
MNNSTSAIRYATAAEQRVSKKTAFIICSGAVAFIAVMIAFVH